MTIWGNEEETVQPGHCTSCEEPQPLHHDACLIFEPFKADIGF